MLILLFLVLLTSFFSSIQNLRDDTIILEKKYYNLRTTIKAACSQIQHKASFEKLDNIFQLGFSNSCNIEVKFEKHKNKRPIYFLPFYIKNFNEFEYHNPFSYILDQPFTLYIKDIEINKKMIELYSKNSTHYLNIDLDNYPYNHFWPNIFADIKNFII